VPRIKAAPLLKNYKDSTGQNSKIHSYPLTRAQA